MKASLPCLCLPPNSSISIDCRCTVLYITSYCTVLHITSLCTVQTLAPQANSTRRLHEPAPLANSIAGSLTTDSHACAVALVRTFAQS
jgi:hypothetical protein